MRKELISVVVPVYKVEDYLKKCVDSIINQTYTNLEIFLVDDGSPDNCGKICDEYQEKDKRIKVIHKENGGLSDARNSAIDQAKGELITFIDSDDYIENDYIELLYNNLKNNDCDISTCSYQCFYDKVELDKTDEKITVFTSEEALENMFYQKQTTTSAWGKLYKIKLFNEVRYPKGKICEDLDTTYKLFAKSKKIVISSLKKYYYLQRTNSIINSKFSTKRMDAIDFAKKTVKFIKQKYPKILQSAYNRLFMEAVFIIIQIPKTEYKKEQNELKKIIKKYRKEVLKDKKSKKGYKVIALASYFGIGTIKLIFKIKK